ncbi:MULTISPECIES: ECF transporter S component [unclassified Breznakia]|uniref:ECF transporter S component n=1 Tax=unclassified Breznakia TaxID=2623764 RepID=UPI002473D0DB|nr:MULTISPECIES: ECF transporter S component [unclassified Breznakia]MDH6367311.1 putative membrane protein [Breznakia sp. PH1-1]MDH6404541.1 putative membrane protein [Breznakia sp. PF1-11]MDH6412250.1 putative membrane protein [Breznakia sp. PFB1-11]MDH6414478.1 putative membrane protein [Breznakia sp. PFB1-14]MDH6416914.1 putative membrane protein [Breznakia sp. PFB1-4]
MIQNKKILWITQTAVFVALLVVVQAATAPLGNTLITGSLVNMLLIISVMTCGVFSGMSVALISPIMAKLVGIGPLWSIIPFVALGNISLILVWYFVGNRKMSSLYVSYIVACVLGAIAKFVVLYIGVVKIAVPIILALPEPQATVVSTMFALPQLFTALLGGVVALLVLPRIKQALNQA